MISSKPQFIIYDEGGLLPLVSQHSNAVTVSTTLSSAQVVTLNSETTWIRMYAKTQGVYVQGGSTVSPTTWDWYVPANATVDVVIPSDVSKVSIIEEAASAKLIMAEYS